MRVQRDFAERVEIMVNATKLTQTQQKELNDKLIAAAIKGDIKNIRELLANGANVDAKSKYGETALFWAACSGKVDIATFLIEKGADVGAKDNYGETALHKAAWMGHVDVAKILIEKGADVDAKDNDGWTALHWVAWNGHVDVVGVLIENGVNVNVKNKNNETAAEMALRCGYHQIAELIDDSINHRKALDILNMDMNELVRMADESAKKLCRKD